METTRVLQVVAELGMGGIQSFLMNVYRNIDRNKIQFDFLLSTEKEGAFEEEIEQLGGKIYRVTSRNASFIKNKKELELFFSEHTEYKCVHCHFSNLSYLMPLKTAVKHNVPMRIVHSHSTHLPKNPVHKILHAYNKLRLDKVATDFFACSDLAGQWLFGGTKGCKKQVIINNGIQTSKYLYNKAVREQVRKDLDVSDKFLIGNVGRLSEPKNHDFIIETFAELLRLNPKAVLILVGNGPEKEMVTRKISKFGIENSVKMLGMRKDIPQLLQAFDCFLMPSKWEGFPVALLEAEAAGLPCYVSDSVTAQAKINENVHYLSLNLGPCEWATLISKESTTLNRIYISDNIVSAGFDINQTVHYLTEIYIRSCQQ